MDDIRSIPKPDPPRQKSNGMNVNSARKDVAQEITMRNERGESLYRLVAYFAAVAEVTFSKMIGVHGPPGLAAPWAQSGRLADAEPANRDLWDALR